jgi:hypothetical protein
LPHVVNHQQPRIAGERRSLRDASPQRASSLLVNMATMTMSMAAPATRAVAGQSKSAATQKAFFGRAAAGSKASVADAFSAMSLSAPTKARGLSICGAYPSRNTRTTRRAAKNPDPTP